MPLLLERGKLRLLRRSQDAVDLAVGSLERGFDLSHLLLLGEAAVLERRLHLGVRRIKDRLDLRLLIGGQAERGRKVLQLVAAPPSAIADRWARRLEDPVRDRGPPQGAG